MNTKKRDKVAGAIYGFAIGDAMGATTEFATSSEIRRIYGKVTNIIGGGWMNLNPGEVTDDTQMTMCVMDALMKYPDSFLEFEDVCIKNFIDWMESGPKDIGGQCAKGIYSLVLGKRISEDNNALGNGSLMRAMPCALLNKVIYNVYQGRLTHNNDICSGVIETYSALLQSYINGCYIDIGVKCLKNPSGYVLDTFNNSVYWSQEKTFKKAILGAVNHGGDADTIAAITGSLAGAKFGYNAIPNKWIKRLDPGVKEFLEKFKEFTFEYLRI